MYFSLERIVCPDVYRAGDGVHKVFLNIENKSKLNPLHPIYLFLETRCFNNAKFIIANSNMIKDEIIDTYGIRPNKIDVVYNGVESKTINHESSFKKLSKEFDIDKNSSILLYVGSGFKRKGVEEFLEIIAKLKNQSVKAFIIGKEKNLEYYQQLSKDLKIDKTVIFTGPRADVDDFYTISDIFLFPTRYEPFSNVVLEAMSFENAVFTTRQNGAHEILTDDYIMASSKEFSVAKKIDDLLEDAKELSDIKRENKLIASKLSIELNMQKTIEVINKG
jgi:UDP-glucose:(heptosyl)LPS alpha-1,3-glucosyltransferase